MIEHSGAPLVSRPFSRRRGLLSWIGNGQLASSRPSTSPARLGRVTDATRSAHHVLGSSPVGVPIGDAIRRHRRCTPCVCVCVCRTVSRSEGEALAARLDCAYFETSAAEDLSSVTTAFGRVLGDVLRLRDRQPTLQVDCTDVPLVRSIDVKSFLFTASF